MLTVVDASGSLSMQKKMIGKRSDLLTSRSQLYFAVVILALFYTFKGEVCRERVGWNTRDMPGQPLESLAEYKGFSLFMWQREDTLMQASEECDVVLSDVCDKIQHSLDLMKITRLHNPALQMNIMLETSYLKKNTYFEANLQALDINIIPREKYVAPVSRSVRYKQIHQESGQPYPADMLTRFCEISDAANELNLRRVLLIDSDVGLFADILDVFKDYPEDVVTPCSWCSQFVLFSSEVLSNFCDAQLQFLTEKQYAHLRQKKPVIDDMAMLGLFLTEDWQKEQRFTYITLQDETPSLRNLNPAKWIAAVSVQFYDIRVPYVWHSRLNSSTTLGINFDFSRVESDVSNSANRAHLNTDCAPFYNFFDVYTARSTETGTTSAPLVSFKGTFLTLPAVHFQGMCKIAVVHEIYVRHELRKLPEFPVHLRNRGGTMPI